MASREPALTDDMRAAVALRHLDARDRARGNAEAYEARPDAHTACPRLALSGTYSEWAAWWRGVAADKEAAARAILPPADSWIEQDWPAPAFVGGA
jgi:hypothetical protein